MRDEVPLRDHVRADERRNAIAEQRPYELRAPTVVVAMIVRIGDVGDVVHKTGDREFEVVGLFASQERAALQGV